MLLPAGAWPRAVPTNPSGSLPAMTSVVAPRSSRVRASNSKKAVDSGSSGADLEQHAAVLSGVAATLSPSSRLRLVAQSSDLSTACTSAELSTVLSPIPSPASATAGAASGGYSGSASGTGTASQLESLVLLSSTVSLQQHPRDVVARAVQLFKQIVQADRCSIFMIDRAEGTLRTAIADGSHELVLPIEAGIVGAVATSGQAVSIPDAYSDSRFDRRYTDCLFRGLSRAR